MSGRGCWTHRCIVSFLLVCVPVRVDMCVLSTSSWVKSHHITYSCSLMKCASETILWCCLCFPTSWPKSQTSGWLTTCVLPSAGWLWAMWMPCLWNRYIYSLPPQVILIAEHTYSQAEKFCEICSGSSVRSHSLLSNRFCLPWWNVFLSKKTWRRTRQCSTAWPCSTQRVLLWYSSNTHFNLN